MSNRAPFHHRVADGPQTAFAQWATTSDGVRLRLAIWPEGTQGTVLLLPGRTEFVEKYGRDAGVLAAAGYATVAIDWRGQGLADRPLEDRATGHVTHFSDYQRDIAEMLATAESLDLPKPYFLLAHSMGGCIGLRALIEGLPVKAAAFSAPMWGILIAPHIRPFACALAWASRHFGFGHRMAPGTKPETYVLAEPFEGNTLTTDPEMYAYMQRQVHEHPDLALGGPSLRWLHEGLVECRRLARLPSPSVPTVTFLGANERIVQTAPIHQRMDNWPGGKLVMMPGAEHEVLMEAAAIRGAVMAQITAHFDAHR